ncbi:MAG: hypothetical protein A3D92_02820 [Bacteroidetes bacterium RIFCSPHIGHO2_02_FULL_44_7]|nr:MAG: hypothetical protein A3D92_02820 [Bacteroidetes bacterium RIFCSPHIGHO2_02_FULL_44_7]
MIQFTGAHIGYKESLLEIRDLHLQKGTLYILVGKNGAGKSTLLKSIIGQERLLSGSLKIDGEEISTLSERQIAGKLAFVRSTFPPTDFLSAFDYVALGRTPYTDTFGRLNQSDREQIDRAFDLLEIRHLKNTFTTSLSDGERQMVAIARAVAQNTSCILLDEPTAFLDYTNKARILQFLKKIAQEEEKCVVLSSHDIELSIDAACPFLLVNTNQKSLNELPVPVQKEAVIQGAFSN